MKPLPLLHHWAHSGETPRRTIAKQMSAKRLHFMHRPLGIGRARTSLRTNNRTTQEQIPSDSFQFSLHRFRLFCTHSSLCSNEDMNQVVLSKGLALIHCYNTFAIPHAAQCLNTCLVIKTQENKTKEREAYVISNV